MPDILIRGMEMPKNCGSCYLNHGEYCFMLCRKLKLPQDWDERPEACPLVELPEHGDLIDICNAENALFVAGNYHLNDYKKGWNDGIKAVIENAPVIVPASEEATNDPKT